MGELAEALGISHVSVSQTRDSLHKAGFVETTADPGDARRKMLRLSKKGRALVNRLKPTWAALSAAAEALDREAGGIVKMLDRLERALERQSIGERLRPIASGGYRPEADIARGAVMMPGETMSTAQKHRRGRYNFPC